MNLEKKKEKQENSRQQKNLGRALNEKRIGVGYVDKEKGTSAR